MAGFIKSVADMFRPVQAVSMQQQSAPTTPNAGSSAPVTPAPAANPLDEFTPLWQNDPNVKAPVDPMAAPLFNTDPAAIAKAASKMDLVGQVDPELMAKAMSGNDPQAFISVLNSVAQRTLTTSAQLNAATIEQATAKNNSRIAESLPGRMKQLQLDTMQSENPALQHPASQPLLQLARAQVQMKNPGMSAAEINTQAERALLGFANQLVAAPQEAAQVTPGGTDWDSWAAT